MSIDSHILKPLDFFVDFKQHELEILSRDFFELIQGDNALGEKIMKKIDKIASERRTIAAGSQ